MGSMTASEARASLPELLDRVDGGEEMTITRHGHPVAVVVRPDTLRHRRADAALANAERVRELLVAARAAARPTSEGLTPERAEELIGEIRAAREAR
jgi:prevent-host-death family protein